MRCHTFHFRRTVVVCVALFLTGSSAWAQTTATPRASTAGIGSNSPISPFLFGPPAYPYRATAPSSYRGVTLPDQMGGGGYRGPSLSVSPPARPPTLNLNAPTRSQPAIGAFIGFGQASSVMGMDVGPMLPGGSYRPAADKRAHISLHVPADAEVWFNGKSTKQTGTVREYHSPELTPGKKYHYEVRVRWMENGKPQEKKQRIDLEARDWLRFDFKRSTAP